MGGDSACPTCGNVGWEFDDSRNESACLGCGHVMVGVNIFESAEGSAFDEDEVDQEDELIKIKREEEERKKKLDSARNPREVPAPKKGSSSTRRVLDRIRSARERKTRTSGSVDWTGTPVIGFGQSYGDDGVWIADEHESDTGSTGEILKAAEVDANREAASFLGLGSKGEGRTDAILAAEKVCPPFDRPEGPLRNPGLVRSGMVGERLRIDQAIASIFMSKFGGRVGRSRPMRKVEDGWGSNNADWVLWELYSQLSLRLGKPWFLSRWANTVGLNTSKLHEIMPCSGESLMNMRLGEDGSRLGPRSMAELLGVFEGIIVEDSVSEIAEQILDDLGDGVSDLAALTLHSEGRPVHFHHGILLLSNRDEQGMFDGSEWWDESEPEEFVMWHIPVALCLVQALYDQRFDHHPDGAYHKLLGFLVDEIDKHTGTTWNELKASWDKLFTKATGGEPFQ